MAAHGGHPDPLEIAVTTSSGRDRTACGRSHPRRLGPSTPGAPEAGGGGVRRRQSVEETRFARADGEFREKTGPDEPGASPFVSVWDMIHQARGLGRWVEQRREGRRETFDVDR